MSKILTNSVKNLIFNVMGKDNVGITGLAGEKLFRCAEVWSIHYHRNLTRYVFGG